MGKRDRQLIELSRRLGALGISLPDQEKLRRIEMTLHRWAERECNGEVERDEKTGKVYARYPGDAYHARRDRLFPVADKETGALRRLREIMATYPRLWWYHQTDPRGCALYVGEIDRLRAMGAVLPAFGDPETADWREAISCRYTQGVAVCL